MRDCTVSSCSSRARPAALCFLHAGYGPHIVLECGLVFSQARGHGVDGLAHVFDLIQTPNRLRSCRKVPLADAIGLLCQRPERVGNVAQTKKEGQERDDRRCCHDERQQAFVMEQR